ncbi:GSCFA domain-containing protein [Hymenobacter lapidiphilus]|uniref:GSCFA domain-containing protein n=1 Tax=Hymenobacter lapidiphilus TaxID=2608003 RepID=A0A7Y7PL83_9BACT|nr:GSCFA domain-containing protein [Hymenobacter lapidiphilus]NVO29874.1 GSCFA domain-containing protein [Hymenobacter lapidiphilus]
MFRTEIPLTPLPHQLPPSARVLTLGSCFSDAIGARLTEFKVATLVNPFGTVFNPISACKLLRAAAGEDVDWQQHLVEARGRWQSYDLHAEIGADSPVELLQHINELTREVGVFLATADVVVLTLGSAFAYRLRETDELVSNCHKVAADQFDKELLTADEIIAAVAETHAYLRRVNPKLRFVLTVSPVRHLKDTLVLNSASKAMLRVACHYLSELLPDVTYFPAYELLVDDLRDYRFYATDMLHLSESAENYVWDKFTRTYFDAAFGRFKKEWEGIRQNLGHRPLHPAAPEHRAFLESTLERLRKLSTTADVRMELLHVERELANLPEPKAPAPIEEEVYDDGEERIDIGSFDDQAATPKVQPVAAAPVVAAAIEPATKPEAGKKQPAKKEINRAVFAKTRLTSQASLIRPGSGLLVEDAEETEAEETDTTDTTESADSTVSAESAYDHAYSPTSTDLTDEVETDEDDETDEADESGEPETPEEAARRKKRRSRGGAKRTKRKHARLAAEQGHTEGQPEGSAVATAPAPLPDAPLPRTSANTVQPDDQEEPASEVVYVTEAQLRQPRPQPTPSADSPIEPASTDDTEPATPEADETTPEARRSRNNRRGNKREQAPRYGGRPGRQPLYAIDAEGPAPIAADTAPAATTTPTESNTTEPVMPSPAVPASAEVSEKPAAKKRTPRPKAPRQPAVASATPAEPAPVEAAPAAATPVATPAPAAPVTPEPAAAKPAARPARRKPAAQPKATTAAVATEAAPPKAAAQPAPEAAKAPVRKRAAAKPKVAATPQAAATTEPALPKPAAPAKPKAPAKAKPKATSEAPPKKTPKAAAKPKAAAEKAVADPKLTAAKTAPAKARTAAKPAKKSGPKKPEAQ